LSLKSLNINIASKLCKKIKWHSRFIR